MNRSIDREKEWKKGLSHLYQVDPSLRKWFKNGGTIEIPQLRNHISVHEFLIRSILSQQLSVAAGNAITNRFLSLFSSGRIHVSKLTAMKPETIQTAGVSRIKAFSIKDLAEKIQTKKIPSNRRLKKLSDEEIVEHLTKVKGIGRWTAEIFLISYLGRMDVLPAEDLMIRKRFASVMELRDVPTAKTVREYGVRWEPYRTVAAKLLWKAG